MTGAALLLFLAGAPLRAQDAPMALSARQVVALAVENNLAVKLAAARDARARGRVLQAAAGLLPKVGGTLSESRVFKLNLAAEGFSGPGPFPQLLGPFDVFDARAQLVWQVLDWSAARRFQSARADAQADRWDEALAREQVSAAAELSYVEALRARRAVAAAEADEELAQSLLKLSQDNKQAGLAAGIDVARARTREAENRLGLIDAQTAAVEAELRLKRTAGIPLGTPVSLEDSLSSAPLAAPALEDALSRARAGRYELRVAERRLGAADLSAKAAGAARLPSFGVAADQGLSGVKPGDGRITGSIGAFLRVPLFAGGEITGRAREQQGKRDEARAQLDDLRLQVEEDVRLSLQQLAAAAERVAAAEQSFTLAQAELQMARDRFAAGVGDNVEVLNGQTAVARARERRISALAQQGDARINLALALGTAGDFQF